MNKINIAYYKTTIGELILGSYDGKLCMLDYRYRKLRTTVDNRIKRGLDAEFVEREDEVILTAKSELDEYLNGNVKEFTVPIIAVGTDFQKTVWSALQRVPYGETMSYLELAKNIGQERAVRAVASANGANAIAIIIPCHRIIETGGGLGGYAGGLAVKKKLLKIEGTIS